MGFASVLENLVENFHEKEQAIENIANRGYVIVINLVNLSPQYYRSTFSQKWQNQYVSNRYALVDPVLYWAAWNEGSTRWSEIRMARALALGDLVLKRATAFGLNYGVIFSHNTPGPGHKKCIFSAARYDREFTVAEISQLETGFYDIVDAVSRTHTLNPGEISVLEGVANGLNQIELAEKLGISKETVKKRLEKARKLLGARNGPQAAAIAVARGIVTIQNS